MHGKQDNNIFNVFASQYAWIYLQVGDLFFLKNSTNKVCYFIKLAGDF